MTHPAITVENLGKAYRIGLKQETADSLIGAVQGLVRSPWKNFQRLSRLNTFRHTGEAEDIVWALKDVSFDVQEGEVVGIIGRNGAGKSTLLKILSRITEPTTGRATIRGRVSSLLEVGTGFHQELTGRENVYMNGTILGMTKREIDRKFDEIVDFSGVEKFLDTPVKRYSSGMRVRLAFSVAAHLEPEILIIDEVLAVGDAEFQRKCLGKMNDVSRSGRTVLFVSHNMGAILELCGRAVLLELGRLVAYGPTESIVAQYGRSSSTYNGSYVDLTNHPGRRGGKSPVFVGLRLLNAKGVAIDQFSCGDPMTIELVVERSLAADLVNIRIGFEDYLGLDVFQVATHLSTFGPIELRERQQILCSLSELALPPGHYSVTLHAGIARKTIDQVEQAVSFDIVPADFYGIGRLPKKLRGRVLVRSNWSVAASNPHEVSSELDQFQAGGTRTLAEAESVDVVLRQREVEA